jgi:hypothetical protein
MKNHIFPCQNKISGILGARKKSDCIGNRIFQSGFSLQVLAFAASFPNPFVAEQKGSGLQNKTAVGFPLQSISFANLAGGSPLKSGRKTLAPKGQTESICFRTKRFGALHRSGKTKISISHIYLQGDNA